MGRPSLSGVAGEAGSSENLELDQLYIQVAEESVDAVINSVLNLVRKGQVTVHKPKFGWDEKRYDKEKVSRINAQKRFNRITRLLNKAEAGDLNAQEELAALNAQLEKDKFITTPGDDVILEDLATLLQAKQLRREHEEKRQKEKEKKRKRREIDRQRAEQRLSRMREEEHKKRQWEEELVQKIREDRDSHIRDRIEKRQREREKEQEMMRLVKSQLKSVHRSIPIHEKWEKQYQEQYVIPELEKRKQILMEKRQNLNRRVKDDVKEHLQKIKNTTQPSAPKSLPKYETKKYKRNSALYRAAMQEKLQQDKMKEDRLKALAAQREFDQEVRKKHIPKIDPSKRNELELRKVDKDAEKREILRERAEAAKRSHGNYLAEGVAAAVGPDVQTVKKKKKKRPQSPVALAQPNYLDELRKNRADRKKSQEVKPKEELPSVEINPNDISSASINNAAEASEALLDIMKEKIADLQQE